MKIANLMSALDFTCCHKIVGLI
ncbi:hypothetical protein XHV734_5001 [Xanthomonas hortorum pv. vitians]|nr:hypothetical protein XHV734_5001 [Xanthomonas hortorum pv. vitians]